MRDIPEREGCIRERRGIGIYSRRERYIREGRDIVEKGIEIYQRVKSDIQKGILFFKNIIFLIFFFFVNNNNFLKKFIL